MEVPGRAGKPGRSGFSKQAFGRLELWPRLLWVTPWKCVLTFQEPQEHRL